MVMEVIFQKQVLWIFYISLAKTSPMKYDGAYFYTVHMTLSKWNTFLSFNK